MNKALKGLLVAMLAVSATVQAHTNKTFLLPRSHGVNLPMEISTFCELVHRKDADKFGANFQAVGFYSGTTNEKETGEYFGILKDKETFSLKYAAAGADIGSKDNIDLGLFIHRQAGAAADGASITLKPSSETWGVRFDYHQDLEKLLKGLYLKVVVPVVHVENDMGLKVESTVAANKTALENFLKGTLTEAAVGAANSQKKLTNALIDGKNSTTGVADIDVVLGYNFVQKEKYHAGINLGFTIPTGDDADGKHAFEAIAGNGDHWAFGAGLCGGARVWGDHDHNVKIKACANYRYLFEGTEKRTLGIRENKESEAYNWSHYVLLADLTKGNADQSSLVPAANVTTLNCDVTPGSQLDAVVAVAYNNGGIAVDFGYNVFWKDDEEVKLKKDQFKDNVWAVAARNYETDRGAAPGAGGTTALLLAHVNAENLSTKVAETPSQVTHKIFASLGYIFKNWECPLMAGLGGGYEFAGSNAALEKWEIWLKLGVGF